MLNGKMKAIRKKLVIPVMGMAVAVFSLPVYAHPCLDDVEDKAEEGASWIERNWEKLEDAVIPETDEERREEAQERTEDAAEERDESCHSHPH